MDEAFRAEMAAGYTFDEPCIVFGAPILGDELAADVRVQLPLSRVNRHGLIAGATGTGKTTTLQLFASQLSTAGVPVFAVDVKGDLSGIGAPGDPTNPPVAKRVAAMHWDYQARGHPIEVLSLSGRAGAHVRASVSSFGPLLLGKVLDLNDTQVSAFSRSCSTTATSSSSRYSTSPTSARPSSTSARTTARLRSTTSAAFRRPRWA